MDNGFDARVVVLGSWVVATVILVVLAVALALLLAIAWDVGKLVRNGFGLCRGWSKGEPYRTRAERWTSPDFSTPPSRKPQAEIRSMASR